MRILLLTLAGLALLAPPALARPVSYPGGWTVMLMNNADQHSAHIHYSPTANYSIGNKLEYWRDGDYTINALQLNNLLHRWNMPDAQANLYLKSGAGAAYSDHGDFDGEIEPAFYTGLAADWENRRFFTSYENRFTETGDFGDSYRQSARVGVAPYIGDYGDLHTWLMLEVGHSPEDDDPVTLTPLVRFFKNTHLVETGISTRGDVMFNWVMRY